jgi:hypothetical protein
MVKLCKKERKAAFKKLEGWFSKKLTYKYADPKSRTQIFESFDVLKNTHIDPVGNYALYECLTFKPETQLKGAVASYFGDEIQLEIVSMEDNKNIATYAGNGKNFRGKMVEFSDNNDGGALGFVGGVTLKKLKKTPKEFKDFDFDKVYKAQYDIVYPTIESN